jgi:hypothetical protein
LTTLPVTTLSRVLLLLLTRLLPATALLLSALAALLILLAALASLLLATLTLATLVLIRHRRLLLRGGYPA